MHIHILGICGTFMGGLAILARQLGYRVSGSDKNVYPPMSNQLEQQGIVLTEGYDPAQLEPVPDLVVVGNAMSRGNPAVEAMLERGLRYTSGPQWLSEHLLQDRWVLACAGTHGKTSTSSMLAWILEYAKMSPGYLIGGVPANFGLSARVGESSFFVIEADEYDSAFFDKRSKFVHYRPRTAVLNNLEFDHADIFEDLAAIQKQFHHLVRTIPSNGRVILPVDCDNLELVLQQGLWSQKEYTAVGKSMASGWTAELQSSDGSIFEVSLNGEKVAVVDWPHIGKHNVSNALSAMAAARHVGVAADIAAQALNQFQGVKRRMELLATINHISVFDDFAHHPTAIESTLSGLRAKVGEQKITAIIELRSNTMRLGGHLSRLAEVTEKANRTIWYQAESLDGTLDPVIEASKGKAVVEQSIADIVSTVVSTAEVGEQIVIMSNGGFEGIHQRLIAELKKSQ